MVLCVMLDGVCDGVCSFFFFEGGLFFFASQDVRNFFFFASKDVRNFSFLRRRSEHFFFGFCGRRSDDSDKTKRPTDGHRDRRTSPNTARGFFQTFG